MIVAETASMQAHRQTFASGISGDRSANEKAILPPSENLTLYQGTTKNKRPTAKP
jgi:hypothetical protein